MDVKQIFMKKFFLIVGIIFAVSAFLMSCSSLTLTCNCTTTDRGVSQSTFESDLKKASKDVGFGGDCSDVESRLKHNYGYSSVSCY